MRRPGMIRHSTAFQEMLPSERQTGPEGIAAGRSGSSVNPQTGERDQFYGLVERCCIIGRSKGGKNKGFRGGFGARGGAREVLGAGWLVGWLAGWLVDPTRIGWLAGWG